MTGFLDLDALKGGLARKLIIAIVVISSLLALIITCVQLYIDYSLGVSSIDQKIRDVQQGYSGSITESVWVLRDEQILEQLNGIVALPGLISAVIEVKGKVRWKAVKPGADQAAPPEHLKVHRFPLIKRYKNTDRNVGTLILTASLDEIYNNLYDKVLLIFFSNSLKTSIVSLFIFFYFHFFITRHLYKLSNYTKTLRLNEEIEPLRLNRSKKPGAADDELDELVNSINSMKENLFSTHKELHYYSTHLEELVDSKTIALQESLDNLLRMQENLVESEKMASLGKLVSGVAHELNTPLGVCITANTFLAEEKDKLNEAFVGEALEKDELQDFLALADQLTATMLLNLNRIADLIKNFKRVAVDASQENFCSFDLVEHISRILAMEQQLRNSGHQIEITGDSEVIIQGDPHAFTQIVTLLVANLLSHAYPGKDSGHIIFDISLHADKVQLNYSDDGQGMTADVADKVFDPFFTTRRNSGSVGLGMHILYNLVTQRLNGEIACDSEAGNGTRYKITFPAN